MYQVSTSRLADEDIEQAYQWWAENRSKQQAQ
jgi:plasmid stabilization system protein ParE